MSTTSFFNSSGSSSTTETNIQTAVDAAEAAKPQPQRPHKLPLRPQKPTRKPQRASLLLHKPQPLKASHGGASEAGSSFDFTTNGGTVGGDVTVSGDISVTGNVDGREP